MAFNSPSLPVSTGTYDSLVNNVVESWQARQTFKSTLPRSGPLIPIRLPDQPSHTERFLSQMHKPEAPSEKTRVVYRESQCLFCGHPEVTGEHLVAKWVHSAFQRTKKPTLTTMRQNLETGDWDDYFGVRQDVAAVACQACNGGWMGRLDNAASIALKPAIRTGTSVLLDQQQQTDVAAWVVKTVIVNDLPLSGPASLLRPFAPILRTQNQAPEELEVWIGPPSFTLADGFEMVGVLPQKATIVLGRSPESETVSVYGWTLGLGKFDLLVRPTLRWIPLAEVPRHRRIWPRPAATCELTPGQEPLNDAERRKVLAPHPEWGASAR